VEFLTYRDRSAALNIALERYVARRLSDHHLEVLSLEERLKEYVGFRTELEVKREIDYLKFLKRLKLLAFEHYGVLEPPLMKPLYPIILPAATTDWDFSATSWNLDTVLYVSSPSSLRLTGTTQLLCKYTGTTNLLEGRVINYFYIPSGYSTDLRENWRNQAAVGSWSTTNRYYRRFRNTGTLWEVREVVAGVDTLLFNGTSYLTGAMPVATWNLVRTTWWLSYAVLMMRFEWFKDGSWQKLVADCSDSTPTGGATVNRCGIGGDNLTRFDDTEIWGP